MQQLQNDLNSVQWRHVQTLYIKNMLNDSLYYVFWFEVIFSDFSFTQSTKDIPEPHDSEVCQMYSFFFKQIL